MSKGQCETCKHWKCYPPTHPRGKTYYQCYNYDIPEEAMEILDIPASDAMPCSYWQTNVVPKSIKSMEKHHLIELVEHLRTTYMKAANFNAHTINESYVRGYNQAVRDCIYAITSSKQFREQT